ncbi:MAG: hypothetical protein ACXWRA_15710 [Pseudobdellovibrionaceae bacterium]
MNMFLALLTMFAAFSAQASPTTPTATTTLPTLITCERNDRERWVEVGIIQNPGPEYRALVVVHDINEGRPELVANRQVFKVTINGTTLYEDAHQTLRLTFSKRGKSIMGSLGVIQNGPGGFMQEGLECFENSTITFEE